MCGVRSVCSCVCVERCVCARPEKSACALKKCLCVSVYLEMCVHVCVYVSSAIQYVRAPCARQMPVWIEGGQCVAL